MSSSEKTMGTKAGVREGPRDFEAAEHSGAVVLKVGGSVLAGGLPDPLIEALARLHGEGRPVVLVHGGGRHVTEVLDRLGLETEFVDGLRVTSPDVMEVVEMVLAGRVNKTVVSAVQRTGIPAVGISGKDGGTLSAAPHENSDRLGLVGRVRSSDTRLVRRLLDGGYLPVVSSVAGDEDGATYNVNADEAASALAASLGADRLVLLTDVPGILRDPDVPEEVVERLTVDQARELLENGAAAGGMRPKIRSCIRALERGVSSSHVLGVSLASSLPDLAAGTSQEGTTITRDREEDSSEQTTGEKIAERSRRVLLGTYRPLPLAFRRGRGSRLLDVDGRTYLDFIGGIAVSTLGHGHPALVDAVSGQVSRYVHVSNLYEIPEQVEAAELLVGSSGLDRAFFCNSGAEAVEGVIKVARKWGRAERGPDCHEIVVMEGAFHGRTLGALSATWNPRYREPFAPLTPGFRRVPFNDPAAVEEALGPEVCAVLVEPVQGEAGVVPADEGYLRALRRMTRDAGILLALDEVQTGIGRTGRMFAHEHYDITPDLVAVAKGLGGGVPVGAVLAAEAVAARMEPGDHATTFGGNALSASATRTVLRTLIAGGGLEHAAEMGRLLRERLEGLVATKARATGVRGLGLLLALQVDGGAGELTRRLAEDGLLVNGIGDGVLRLAPPLVVTPEDIEEATGILGRALS